MNFEVLSGLCKLFFSMICFFVGSAILLTIPVTIYFLFQEKNIKAKKIIRKLIDDVKNYSYLDKLEDIEEAEEYLKVD